MKPGLDGAILECKFQIFRMGNQLNTSQHLHYFCAKKSTRCQKFPHGKLLTRKVTQTEMLRGKKWVFVVQAQFLCQVMCLVLLYSGNQDTFFFYFRVKPKEFHFHLAFVFASVQRNHHEGWSRRKACGFFESVVSGDCVNRD